MAFIFSIILVCRFVSYLADRNDKKLIRFRQLERIKRKIEEQKNIGGE